MKKTKPRPPARKRRRGGRILPAPSVRDEWYGTPKGRCAICSTAIRSFNIWHTQTANGRWFCYDHSPKKAAAALASYSNGNINHVGGPYRIHTHAGQERITTSYARLRRKNLPDRATCEKILRLAGMTVPTRKPAKPKKKPRDRRYVR